MQTISSSRNRTFILLIFLVLHNVSQAQVLHGKVIDKATGQALPYASVGISKNDVGGITDKNGTFSIDVSRAAKGDSLIISYIGYAGSALLLSGVDATKELTIGLAPAPKDLPEIPITGKRRIIEIGNVKYNGRFTGWGDFSASRGRLRGMMIALQYPVHPVALAFRIRRNTFDSVKVRLQILGFHGESLPLNELLQDNIYVTIPKNAKWVTMDLAPYHLVLRDTIVLAVEWVDAWAPPYIPEEGSFQFTFSDSNTRGLLYSCNSFLEKPVFIKTQETLAMYLKAYRVGNGQ